MHKYASFLCMKRFRQFYIFISILKSTPFVKDLKFRYYMLFSILLSSILFNSLHSSDIEYKSTVVP